MALTAAKGEGRKHSYRISIVDNLYRSDFVVSRVVLALSATPMADLHLQILVLVSCTMTLYQSGNDRL
jgi:hypothetical protein